ncbi:two-component regulator propeller domain-containing protein [Polaribacter tangerinus]|uniref:type IX secretion system anionic LPS delivery protein PorZ n=1 Tax=Polaribacter tangerinus TaxID=1920034 RepID=UPI000B4AD6DD|nr:two-component regulator propeller domain-containing protein [Polaribacter tangerinus]
MKKIFSVYFLFLVSMVFSQTDYSDSWEDFYAYNNVKDFVIADQTIFALVDNAVFTYHLESGETNKISSIQGLSGENTTAIYYNTTFKRLVIGYETGLIEVLDNNGTITISSDIVNFNQSGEKSINHISEYGNTLYLSTPFAIVEYNIEKLEFGDTFFIGNGSSAVKVNQTLVSNNQLFAATEQGVFKADLTSSLLIDFKNWQPLFDGRNIRGIQEFQNDVYVIENNSLLKITSSNLTSVKSFTEKIVAIKTSASNLTVSLKNTAIVLNTILAEEVRFTTNSETNFTLNTAFFENGTVFLATKELGVLSASAIDTGSYLEIHPQGPLSNKVFSIDVHNKNLWVVYGGYNSVYGPVFNRQGFSHYNGETWLNTPFNPNFPITDLSYITIDTNAENKVYISSLGDTRDVNSSLSGGLLVVENDEIVQFYNHLNSPLEDIESLDASRVTIRITGTALDRDGNLWVANIGVPNELKKLSTNGQWTSVNMSSVKTNPSFGLSEMAIDRNNSVWYGSRNNGVFVYNENGNRKKSLIATPNLGNLPNATVKSVIVDKNNNVWMGTNSGLVVYNNTSGVFEETVTNANPIIILDDGIPKKLAGDQSISSIAVDGANNKWIGTDNGGVLYTNPNGQNTLANFSKKNSPLPSNRILKIKVENTSGKVYFATDKGIVAYNSNVAPFSDTLTAVYAYPNPVLKSHEFVTIAGRNGTTLPKGTNVKILDIAGNLVHETNVVEGQELQGGKVVWNKRNLAGNKVASGVYIVLLSTDDASETAMTKIAIVN